ncbi:BRCT domain-containing protein [Infundibulicybe gibba]|nr:BRCT domain-containing protein [Infundibulicybe gibba]
MDRYFPIVSKSTPLNTSKEQKRANRKYQPYQVERAARVKTGTPTNPNISQGGSIEEFTCEMPLASEITAHILSTLSHEANPITHSDAGDRADHVVSSSTGHQVSEERYNRRLHLKHRGEKLTNQREPIAANPGSRVLRNCRIYINGFLSDTTDIEMKRIVLEAGGQILATPSGCTHILTSQQLSGSKTHKILMTKSRNKIQVVKPEWVTDSIRAGKKQPERGYAIIKDRTTNNLFDMWQK